MPPFIDISIIRKIIKDWSILLRENVKPLDILQSIQGLQDSDIQHVECETRNNGNRRGMDALLDDIPRRDSHVFFNFLVALEQHGYEGIAREIIECHRLGEFAELKTAREKYGRPAPLVMRQGDGSRGNDSGFGSRSVPHTPPGQPRTTPGQPHTPPGQPLRQGGVDKDSLYRRSRSPPLSRESMNNNKVKHQHQHGRSSKTSERDDGLSLETHMDDILGELHEEWANKLNGRWKTLAKKRKFTRKEMRDIEKGQSAIKYLDKVCEEDETFTVGKFLEEVRVCGFEDMVVTIENALGIRRNQGLQRSNTTCTSTLEVDGDEQEFEEVFIGATPNTGNDNFNNLNETSRGELNIRPDENDQRNTSVDDNDTTKTNASPSHDERNSQGKQNNVTRKRDDSCDSNLLSHSSHGKSYDNKGNYDSNLRGNKDKEYSDERQNKNDYEHKSYTSKSVKLSFSSNGTKNENRSPTESTAKSSSKKLEHDKNNSDDLMKRDSTVPGELVRKTQEEEFEKLREQTDDTEVATPEKDQRGEVLRDNSSNLASGTISSPHGSKLNPESLFSSMSLESVDTEPKVIEEGSNFSFSRQEPRPIQQPVTDPDNNKRPEPLLSTEQSSNIPSLGSNVMMYEQSRVSNRRDQNNGRQVQTEEFNANKAPVHPSSYTNEDVGDRESALHPMNAEQTENRIAHPSSYTGETDLAYGNRNIERHMESEVRNVSSIPVSHRDPIIDQPESSEDTNRRYDLKIDTQLPIQTQLPSSELSAKNNTPKPSTCVDGKNDIIDKTDWQNQNRAVTHPSSTQLSSTSWDTITDHPVSRQENQDDVHELDGRFAGLAVTHPSSTQLSQTQRGTIREDEEPVCAGDNVGMLHPFVAQPESSKENQEFQTDTDSERGQPPINNEVTHRESGRDLHGGRYTCMTDESPKSSSNPNSLIVTHPDSYQGNSLPKGRLGCEEVSCIISEDNRMQSTPRSEDMANQRRAVVLESNRSSKQSEKNCETEAADLRVEQSHQINMDSYRDIQRSIPGSPARDAEQAQHHSRNSDSSDVDADDTHEKEPS